MNREQPHIENASELKEIMGTLDTIRRTGIFDDAYFNKKFLLFGKDKDIVFERGSFGKVSEDVTMQDFMQGRRTDIIGIEPRGEYEAHDRSALSDLQFLPALFLEKSPVYEEFVAHEMAHNVFDSEYKARIGEFVESRNVTDVSDGYRNSFRAAIGSIMGKYYPRIDTQKFSFSRQQIAEIFAMLYEREFCRRANLNRDAHERVVENAEEFSADPENTLAAFNKEYSRHCTMDDFYRENHILSLLAAPALEREFSDFGERMKVFWEGA